MQIIALVFSYIVLQMSFTWIIYRLLKNPSVVDASWSIGLLVSGLIYLGSVSRTPRIAVVALLLSVWALRLAGYLWYTRILQGHIDKRYTKLSDHWKINKSLGFFLNFQLQGALIFIISFIFYFISHSDKHQLTYIDYINIFIILTGVVGETVADLQLRSFKSTGSSAVCELGLWYYSRHPNYFFDWLTWLGFTFFALQSKQGYFSLVSLGLLYLIFTKITGPITERGSIESRGEKYIAYQKQTSMFFPWFKTKIYSE